MMLFCVVWDILGLQIKDISVREMELTRAYRLFDGRTPVAGQQKTQCQGHI